MTMAPVCLVCGKPLRATGGDANMYYCDSRKEWVSEFGVLLDVVDTVIYVDPKRKRETMWVVDIPPYRFTMTDFEAGPKTEVHQQVLPDTGPWDKDLLKKFLFKKKILTVPAVMKLPWHDRKRVLDRLKLYMLFS